MIITYRNPLDLNDTIDVHFALYNSDFHTRWKDELKKLLTQNYHLEKNYCFMGFVDTPRNVEYLCEQINEAIGQINRFNTSNKWQDAGLESYAIQDHFETDTVMYSADLPIGPAVNGDKMAVPGLRIKHDAMNRLHRYFEDLQGEAWGLSSYYKIADHETKYAIRQLNDLCHELECYILSYRKYHSDKQWQRPCQIISKFLEMKMAKISMRLCVHLLVLCNIILDVLISNGAKTCHVKLLHGTKKNRKNFIFG